MISLWILLRTRSILDKIVAKIKTQIYSLQIFSELCRLWDKVEKYGRSGQATDSTRAHVLYTLDIQSYKHTLRICNSYCFSTGTRLIVTSYVPRLPCFFKERQYLTLFMAFIYRLKEFFITTLSVIRLNQLRQGYYVTIFPGFNVLLKWPFPLLSGILDPSWESFESSSCFVSTSLSL
jgi:hypothetical protein